MNRLEELTSKIQRTEQFIQALERRLTLMRAEIREEIRTRPLTARQREILGMVRTYSNKEIANRLNISERGVKFHISNLLERFSVESRIDLP